MFNLFGNPPSSGENGTASIKDGTRSRTRNNAPKSASESSSKFSFFGGDSQDPADELDQGTKAYKGTHHGPKHGDRSRPFFGQTQESESPGHIFLAARNHWKGRSHELQASQHQWMLLSMLLTISLIVSVSVSAYLSVTSRVEPYVVAVDSERGDILRAGTMERIETPSDAIMRNEVEEFIRGLRTVYTDRRATHRSYQRMGNRLRGDSEASAFLTNLFSRENPNREDPPLALVGEMQRYISDIRVSQISGTRSWNIRWTEVTNRPGREAEIRNFEGTASALITRSTSREEVKANPFGTQIDGLAFEEV